MGCPHERQKTLVSNAPKDRTGGDPLQAARLTIDGDRRIVAAARTGAPPVRGKGFPPSRFDDHRTFFQPGDQRTSGMWEEGPCLDVSRPISPSTRSRKRRSAG